MLEELRVENLLLIEQAQLRLAPGLNVLTGETGAGKTVLAHALDLLLGGRPRAGIVRPGASEAYVEGIFHMGDELSTLDALRARAHEDGDSCGTATRAALHAGAQTGELVLARRVGADGRTRAYVNGRAAAVSDLRDLGGALVAFYGQHEHRKLTLATAQLELLDGVCGEQHAEHLRACAHAFARVRELERDVERLQELGGARVRELDLLEHELAEIDALAGDLDEHEQLLATRERLRRIDALLAAAGAAEQLLGSDAAEGSGSPGWGARAGAAALAAEAVADLDALAGLDPLLDSLAERAGALAVEAQELSSELRSFCERTTAEVLDAAGEGRPDGAAGALESVEERLSAIDRLVRKHGGHVESVREHALTARARRDELANAEVTVAQAGAELAGARAELDAHVLALRRAREAAAVPYAQAVREQLAPLAMPGASFEVALAEAAIGPAGADAVEFLIAPNRGVPAAPLRDIASGGELSRVMLAIMSAADAGGERPTLVFDEVDAGIGGQTARAVGARLRALAEHRQILCITHLPQIASLAARHFTVVKDAVADTALARVCQLDEQDVLSELVRMMGADSEDKGARRHARELLRAA